MQWIEVKNGQWRGTWSRNQSAYADIDRVGFGQYVWAVKSNEAGAVLASGRETTEMRAKRAARAVLEQGG
jgi:hypothetical protein